MNRKCLWLILPLLMASVLVAQGIPTATLNGRAVSEGLALPGVNVQVKSPALQGVRSAVTGPSGDFVFVNLPPGEYVVTFTLSGFQPLTRSVRLAASQQSRVDVSMGLTAVAAVATVVGQAESISDTPQASTSYSSDLIEKLPTARNILSSVVLTAGVNTNGPNNNITISGSMSFENLFTINGVVATENIRGTPYNLFIEDAIQETTTSVSGISAEYGRFTGGVVNAITKSGGNVFSGSFRTSLTSDQWTERAPNLAIRDANYNPPPTETVQTRADDVNPRYEATLGGPVIKDRIWFFVAGRLEEIKGTTQTLNTTNLPYESGLDEKRLEGKLTLTPFSNHTFVGAYTRIDQEQTNYVFPSIPPMDFESVYDRQNPQELLALNYSGVLTSNLFVEAQYSKRKFTFENSGGRFTDLIKGTVVRDRARATGYNSPVFCAVCGPEMRDNDNYLVKGTYFLSTKGVGSHNITFGYDDFGGQRMSNNHQSGSDYHLFGTTSIIRDGVVYPQWLPNSTILVYYPIPVKSQGSDIRTRSVFLNDSWRLNDQFSFNLGLRWDKNDATDSFGTKTAKDSALSPRLSVAYDPGGKGTLRFVASYARYVGAPAENQASAGSPAGSPAIYQYVYRGPAINPVSSATTLVTTAEALAQIFAYFGVPGPGSYPSVNADAASVPGVNLKIVGSLDSPNVNEYTLGVSGRFLEKGTFRVDGVFREYADFYNERCDLTTGKVQNSLGQTFDFRAIENTSAAEREYLGLHTSFSYRASADLSFGGNWTWSRARGNFDGETSGSGPVRYTGLLYPEYIQEAWNTPRGDLAIDQRHRVGLYATYDLPFVPEALGIFTLSGIQSINTGTPYGAAGTINSGIYVTNPGYATPPGSSGVTYWFTSRDAFRTPTIYQTDLSLNYSKAIGPIELFIQPQVLNVFNNSNFRAVNTTTLTALSTGGGSNAFVAFNPFTSAPVQRPNGDTSVKNANWDFGPNFGRPTAFSSYQQPRSFRISLGLRF
jgi:outer membrane receptor for ferrienterochelin and colicin